MAIRKYCLHDPEHAKFFRHFLEKFRSIQNNQCSEDHAAEKSILACTWKYIEQVLCRDKDRPEIESILTFVYNMMERCTKCCKVALMCLVGQEQIIRSLLLKVPDERIRKRITTLILSALELLRTVDRASYGLNEEGGDDQSSTSGSLDEEGTFVDVVFGLRKLLPLLPMHHRMWDEFYTFLTGLARFGSWEASILHRAGFLQHCLEVVILYPANKSLRKDDYPQHFHLFRLMDKRRYSLLKLLGFVAVLLEAVQYDLVTRRASASIDPDISLLRDDALTQHEEKILHWAKLNVDRQHYLPFLDRAIQNDDENCPAVREIVKTLVRNEDDLQLLHLIESTITVGFMRDPASDAGPYLFAALALMETCPHRETVKSMVHRVADGVKTIGLSGGDVHLEFFRRTRLLRNPRAFGQRYDMFNNYVLQTSSVWGPPLLCYPDQEVRTLTGEFIFQILLHPAADEQDDEMIGDRLKQQLVRFYQACLEKLQGIAEDRQQVESEQLELLLNITRYCQQFQERRLGDDPDPASVEILEGHSG